MKTIKILTVAILSMLIIYVIWIKEEPIINAEIVNISPDNDFTISNDGSKTLTASILPNNAIDSTITWSVAPQGVVTITSTNKGVTITAAEGVGYGEKATITAAVANGISDSVEVTVIFDDGYVVVDGEWQIYTEKGLKAFGQAVNGGNYGGDSSKGSQFGLNAKLMQDITLTAPAEGESNWTPIGWYVFDTYHGYYGTFDGNDKSISDLHINSTADEIGLFGVLINCGEAKYGTVKNTTLINPVVRGRHLVGAIAGCAIGSTIVRCSVEGENASVIGTGIAVGGIVGTGANASIIACYNTANITGTDKSVGGVVGYGGEATITACYNTASVTGTNDVGGVVGYGNEATITACYNTASVTGEINVGGVVGNGTDAVINTVYWIDNADDNTEAAHNGTSAFEEAVNKVDNKESLNSEEVITELNNAIPTWVTNYEDINIVINYKFRAGESTPMIICY